ncbi:hypothetical protein XENOCAPTIV_022329, partial [Xenoophorus captivus]
LFLLSILLCRLQRLPNFYLRPACSTRLRGDASQRRYQTRGTAACLGFSVGSTETSGPAQQSSSGLASERDSRHLMPPPTSLRVNGVRHQLEDRRIQQAFVEPAVKRLRTGLVAYAGDSSDEEEDHPSSKASWLGNHPPTSSASTWAQGFRCPPPLPTRAKMQPQQQSIPFWMAP